MSQDPIATPPRTTNADGEPRRVGVEIEFADLPLERAAQITADLFGGTIEQSAPFCIDITDTRLGDFTVELDSQYAQPDGDARVSEIIAEVVGEVSKSVVPSEITCPPIAYDRITEIAGLMDAMAKEGAAGTDASLFYAFGLQLNPEVSAPDAETILPVLRAYLILSDALRAEIEIDSLRRLLPFANAFPLPYRRRIIDPDYAPGMDRLIDDFLAENATRNRELDLLPLFAHIDEDRVRKVIDDPRIKPRPTFHYRLPNALFENGGAHLVREWNRWVAVEKLAADSDALARVAGDFMEASKGRFDARAWAEKTRAWLEP